MGTRGTSFTSEATVEIAGYEFSDQVIEGNTNTSILGVKTETVVGGMGIGVAGVWTDVALVKMEFSNLKLGVNYGSIGEFHYGWKYERSPVGTFEGHDTLFQIIQGAHWTDTQQTWHVSAGMSATIKGPTINLNTGATGPASMALNYQNANLLFSGNGLIANPVQTAISHSIQATLSSGSNCLLINPAGLYANSVLANINATVVNLGQPPVDDPDIASMFEEAEAEAQAEQELNAAGQALAEWLETFLGGEDEELIGIPG